MKSGKQKGEYQRKESRRTILLSPDARPFCRFLPFTMPHSLSNKRGEGHIPEEILRDLARLLLPQIIRMYESEEGKKQLAEWKAEQEKQKEIVAAESKSECAKRP